MNKLKIGMASIAILVGFIASDQYMSHLDSKPFTPIEGKHFVEVENTPQLKKAMGNLNIKSGNTFEIMSYTCPACRTMDFTINNLASKYNLPTEKFQLGMDDIQLAEAEFYIKTRSPNNINDFRKNMFAKILSNDSYESKLQYAKTAPLEYGLDMEDLGELEVSAKLYKQHTIELADALELKSTPALYLGGKYHIIQSEHKNFEQFEITYKAITDKIKNN